MLELWKAEKQFESARAQVKGVDPKIQFVVLKIDSYWFSSTPVYSAVQI